MSRVHRVAWRMEKPRRLTVHIVVAAAMFAASLSYVMGWMEPGRWTAACFSFALALSYLIDDIEARAEYATYETVVKGVDA